MQSALRMFSESWSIYAGLINNFSFLIYLSIGAYIILSLISITSDWYISRVHQHNLEETYLGNIDQRTVRSIQYMFQLIIGFFCSSIHYCSLYSCIVIGLAAQNTLDNIIAGIVISIYNPLRIRDRIRIEKLDTGVML